MEVHTGTEGTHKVLTIVSRCLVDHLTHVLDEAIVGFPFLIFVVEQVDDLCGSVCPNVEGFHRTLLCFLSCAIHVQLDPWVLLLKLLEVLSVGSTGICSEQFSCTP